MDTWCLETAHTGGAEKMAAFSAVAWRHCASVPHRRRSRWFPGQNDSLTLDDSMPVAVSLDEYDNDDSIVQSPCRRGSLHKRQQKVSRVRHSSRLAIRARSIIEIYFWGRQQ